LRRGKTTVKALCCLPWSLFFGTSAARAQGRTEHLSVSGDRPVADAVERMERKFGFVVTYEDPEFVAAEDIQEIPTPKGSYRAMNGGALSVDFEVGPDGAPLDRAGLVNSIAAAGSNEGLRFDSWQSGDGAFHVIPVTVRDRDGKPAPFESALDTRISFPAGERNGEQFLKEICASIARARHLSITVGTTPDRMMDLLRISRGATNEVARDVLASFLSSVSDRLSWHFLCLPGPPPIGGCALNVHLVPRQRVAVIPNTASPNKQPGRHRGLFESLGMKPVPKQ
jgi:hypothetical protein